MKRLVFKTREAVANQSGAMGAETISKNGRSSKSLMSRGNFFKYFGIISFVAVITVVACSFGASNQSVRWEYTILYLDVKNNEYKTFGDNGLSDSWLKGGNAIMRQFGEEGWELVSASNNGNYNIVYFKRRLP